MQGVLHGYDPLPKSGFIMTDDKQYVFAKKDYVSKSKRLINGITVKFLPENDHAKQVEFYKASALTPAKKRKFAAFLALILGGSMGSHKIYLGQNFAAFVMLVLFLFGAVNAIVGHTFGILIWVVTIIAIIEGIIYLSLSEEDFVDRYVVGTRKWF